GGVRPPARVERQRGRRAGRREESAAGGGAPRERHLGGGASDRSLLRFRSLSVDHLIATERSPRTRVPTQRSIRPYTTSHTCGPCSTGSSIARDSIGAGSKSPSSSTSCGEGPKRSQIVRRCVASMT